MKKSDIVDMVDAYINAGGDMDVALMSRKNAQSLLECYSEFTKDELFMLKLLCNEAYNSGNKAYEDIAKKINKQIKYLNSLNKDNEKEN